MKARRRFDPAQTPLARFGLVRMERDWHRLVFTHHHILLDGWALGSLLEELRSLADSNPGTAKWERATAYRDYLTWLSRQEVGLAQKAWQEALAGLENGTRLVETPSASEINMVSVSGWASAEATTALIQSAKNRGVTQSTLVEGAWGAMLCN